MSNGTGGDQDKAQEQPTIHLVMVEGCYDERSSKAHVRRLRELLRPPDMTPGSAAFALLPVRGPDGKMDAASLEDDASGAGQDDEAADACHQQMDPSSLVPLLDVDLGASDASYKDPQCLKSLALSALNPAPAHRRLVGDLAYYDVVLCDDRRLCVTASVRGFFVNNSSRAEQGQPELDAGKSDAMPHTAYTLVGLLSIVSPAFKRNWAKLMQVQMSRDPLESIPRAPSVTSWAAAEGAHLADPARVEDGMAVCYGVETGAPARDWNEEYQNCKELPALNQRQRLVRERTALKVSSDFVEAATKGAVAIVDRCIPPINPMDVASAHMYVFNSIFFSYAVPTDEAREAAAAEAAGGAAAVAGAPAQAGDGGEDKASDQPTYASSNQDLHGVRLMGATDIEGLYTLATAVIDYRGFRIVAQSIIPGILQSEQLGSLVYGSVDNGAKFVCNPDFHNKVSQAARELHLKEHDIIDGAGEGHKALLPVECKGIMGSDSRSYLLDLIRLTPPDPNATQTAGGGSAGVLRSELLDRYMYHLNLDSFAVNVNVKLGGDARVWKLGGPPQGVAEDEADIRKVAQFLLDDVIPGMVQQCRALDVSPLDGRHLTEVMHAHGINMRYLSAVHAAASTFQVDYLRVVCEREMLARAVKHVLRQGLTRTGPSFLAAACAHLLNCLLGRVSPVKSDKQKKKKGEDRKTAATWCAGSAAVVDAKGPLLALCSNSLWASIQEQVASRFKFELPADRQETLARVGGMPLVRAVCQLGGIQIRARAFDLTTAHPFSIGDILALHPIAKGSLFRCKEGQVLVSQGKALGQMGHLDSATAVLLQALDIQHHTCGLLHGSTASAYSALAMVCYQQQQHATALTYQQKAIVILEKTFGVDHYQVAQAYANMVMFSHALGQNRRALRYMRRAEYLLALAAGPNHPDLAALYVNAGMIHLQLNQSKTALRYLHKALTINQAVLEPKHSQTASTYHYTALALVRMGARSAALKNAQTSYDMLLELYGENDPRVQESGQWLNVFKSKLAQKSPTALAAGTPHSESVVMPIK